MKFQGQIPVLVVCVFVTKSSAEYSQQHTGRLKAKVFCHWALFGIHHMSLVNSCSDFVAILAQKMFWILVLFL